MSSDSEKVDVLFVLDANWDAQQLATNIRKPDAFTQPFTQPSIDQLRTGVRAWGLTFEFLTLETEWNANTLNFWCKRAKCLLIGGASKASFVPGTTLHAYLSCWEHWCRLLPKPVIFLQDNIQDLSSELPRTVAFDAIDVRLGFNAETLEQLHTRLDHWGLVPPARPSIWHRPHASEQHDYPLVLLPPPPPLSRQAGPQQVAAEGSVPDHSGQSSQVQQVSQHTAARNASQDEPTAARRTLDSAEGAPPRTTRPAVSPTLLSPTLLAFFAALIVGLAAALLYPTNPGTASLPASPLPLTAEPSTSLPSLALFAVAPMLRTGFRVQHDAFYSLRRKISEATSISLNKTDYDLTVAASPIVSAMLDASFSLRAIAGVVKVFLDSYATSLLRIEQGVGIALGPDHNGGSVSGSAPPSIAAAWLDSLVAAERNMGHVLDEISTLHNHVRDALQRAHELEDSLARRWQSDLATSEPATAELVAVLVQLTALVGSAAGPLQLQAKATAPLGAVLALVQAAGLAGGPSAEPSPAAVVIVSTAETLGRLEEGVRQARAALQQRRAATTALTAAGALELARIASVSRVECVELALQADSTLKNWFSDQ